MQLEAQDTLSGNSSLSAGTTFAASAGALLGWVIALLGTFQLAYMRNVDFLLDYDVLVMLVALSGFAVTMFFIMRRSRLELPGRIVLGALALVAFLTLMVWGGFEVSCANGNCL